MHSSTSSFSVGGMSTSTSNWGQSTSNLNPSSSFSVDSLSQSRSHYQSGYLLSASQANASPHDQGPQRPTDISLVNSKAQINHALKSDFGVDSMFQSSRQRQNLADEDAPPTNSVNDIPNEIPSFQNSSRFQPKSSALPSSRRTRTPPSSSNSPHIYIIVFGYPQDKYTVTVEYFKSLSEGECTEADPNTEILNCFRIGYRDVGDAMRAVRKNGEVLGGSWMIGVKWADPAQAENLLGQPISRASFPSAAVSPADAMSVDEPSSPIPTHSNGPTVGTPIRLAPSASIFRKGQPSTPTPGPPAPQKGLATPTVNQSPSKGVIGQVSDLIFGW